MEVFGYIRLVITRPKSEVVLKIKNAKKCPKVNLSFSGRFKGLGGHGSMREPLEMFTASLIQNMVQIRKENICSMIKLLFRFV